MAWGLEFGRDGDESTLEGVTVYTRVVGVRPDVPAQGRSVLHRGRV